MSTRKCYHEKVDEIVFKAENSFHLLPNAIRVPSKCNSVILQQWVDLICCCCAVFCTLSCAGYTSITYRLKYVIFQHTTEIVCHAAIHLFCSLSLLPHNPLEFALEMLSFDQRFVFSVKKISKEVGYLGHTTVLRNRMGAGRVST